MSINATPQEFKTRESLNNGVSGSFDHNNPKNTEDDDIVIIEESSKTNMTNGLKKEASPVPEDPKTTHEVLHTLNQELIY